MGPEIPRNAVVVSDKEPLEDRLKMHPLGPGETYYFVSEVGHDGLPSTFGLTCMFEQIENEFIKLRSRDLPNTNASGIVSDGGQTHQDC